MKLRVSKDPESGANRTSPDQDRDQEEEQEVTSEKTLEKDPTAKEGETNTLNELL